MKKYCLVILFVTAGIICNAQSAPDSSIVTRLFTIKELKEDLAILKDSLQILHPALYRYAAKQSFDAAFLSTYKNINKPMSLADFYGLIAPIMGKAGDIHTALEFPDEFYSYLSSKAELFPFDVRIVNGEIFIASNNSPDSTIETGDKILKINDQPGNKLLQKMESYFSSEGSNITLKLRRVEQRFAFQYYIAFGYSKEFKIQYADKNKLPVIKSFLALPFSEIRANRTKNRLRYPTLKPLFVQPPYLGLTIVKENQTAILTIKWFQNDVLQTSGEQFKPFIDSAFTEINKAGTSNLVIDIRGNEGGESGNAAYLYSYLTGKPFRFLQYLETNKRAYENDTRRGVKYVLIKETGKYRTSDVSAPSISSQFFGLDLQQPQSNNFKGNVFVLADGLTSSAAPQFASLVKLNKRGVLIGEELPGSLYGGSGRGYSYFYLPNTGILAMISQYRVGIAGAGNNTKDILISPDHKIATTMADLLRGVDRGMQLALQLAGSKK